LTRPLALSRRPGGAILIPMAVVAVGFVAPLVIGAAIVAREAVIDSLYRIEKRLEALEKVVAGDREETAEQ
jgi:hypothetical protein